MNYCPNCGKEQKEGAKFCPGCGYNLDPDKGIEKASFSEKMKDQLTKMTVDTEEQLHLEKADGLNITRAELKIEAQRKLSGRYGEWFKTIIYYLLAIVILVFITGFSWLKLISGSFYGYINTNYYYQPFFGISKIFWFLLLLLAIVALILLSFLLNAVFQWCAIFTLRGQRADGVKIFFFFIRSQKNRVLKANVLIAIYTFFWSLLFVIPGIVKSASYAMTNFLLEKQPELTASEAINLSRKLMHGYKLEYLILTYSFWFWKLLVSLTNGLASFYVIPYQNVTSIEFFEVLYNRYTNAE